MALLDDTASSANTGDAPFAPMAGLFRSIFVRKQTPAADMNFEKGREDARRAVDRVLKSSGSWPLG